MGGHYHLSADDCGQRFVGQHMDTYLGLFNGSVCMPQIVASLLSFVLFPMLGGHQATMFLVAGAVLLLGAFSVCLIKETHGGV